MNTKNVCFAIVATLATAALNLSAAQAQTYGASAMSASTMQDATVRAFPRSNTGSDPSTNLPYAATIGRPSYAQGQS
jgi:hypothetical protein